ncbi:MAG: hypothetical protein R3A79_05575 [Nannocystaceae bacterium]
MGRSTIHTATARRRLLSWALALAPLFALASAACHASGDTCTKNSQCADSGVCLKGVCSGYTCEVDEDCPNAQVCASIGGNDVCALPCAGDAPCPGSQRCKAPSDDPEAAYCL